MSTFLMVFSFLQTAGACVTVLNNRHWISKSLSLSWQRAYERSADLIEEIQYEVSFSFFNKNCKDLNEKVRGLMKYFS